MAKKKKLRWEKVYWDKHTDAHEIANAMRGHWILVEGVIMPNTKRLIKVGKIKKITSISPSQTRIRREVHFTDGETNSFRAVAVGDILKVQR